MIYPNGRCHKHNGGAAAGIAHPQAIHLRTSKRMPRRLQADYEAALKDPDLLSLDPEIATLDVHQDSLKQQLEHGYDEQTWKLLHTLADALEESIDTENDDAPRIAAKMVEVIRKGAYEEVIWKAIEANAKLRGELVEKEQKRRIALRQLISSEQALALATGMVAVVKEATANLFTEVELQTGTRLSANLRGRHLMDISDGIGGLLSKPAEQQRLTAEAIQI